MQFDEICSFPQVNMHKVDHQALSYIKVLSETRLYGHFLIVIDMHGENDDEASHFLIKQDENK